MCRAPFCSWLDQAPKQTVGKTIEMPQCHIAPKASNERKATGTNDNVHSRRSYLHTVVLKKCHAILYNNIIKMADVPMLIKPG
jgi:hypothetical protein